MRPTFAAAAIPALPAANVNVHLSATLGQRVSLPQEIPQQRIALYHGHDHYSLRSLRGSAPPLPVCGSLRGALGSPYRL